MMLEELYEDNLIGDPNDLEEVIERQGEQLFDEAEEQEIEDNANNGADDNENSNATRVEPKKRTVRNPRLKLDPERLKGPRGIAVLDNSFKDFKFHGKGYESVDLNRVMKRLEHWAHRLYPRFQFDDCLDKIEKLGQKKTVQVYVKKIRMGLETVEEPVVLLDEVDESDVHNEVPIDAFDELLSQQLSQVRPENQTEIAPSQIPSLPHQPLLSQSADLTAEQRERMLRNRLLAEERRLARMKSKHELQKAAEAELSTVDGLTAQPSAVHDITTLVSNMEATNSAVLPCHELNSSFIDTVDAHEVNSTFTSAVCATYTTCETDDISVFCNVIEIEGTKNITKSVGTRNQIFFSEPVNEETNIFKTNEKGKIIPFSKPVEAEDVNANSTPVHTEQANTTLIPVDTQEVNITSELGERRESNNATFMLDDSEQTHATSVLVDGEEIDTVLMPIDPEKTDTILKSVSDTMTDATSIPVNAKETGAPSVPVDTEETNTSLSVEIEENI
ncbi:uncharacterized protein LOC111866539 isoform X2 [Cryptotermes secundus]|uniref:uncharacterized protein LOC111866539 isoform X2 n=1 Tax=Cryptotermes secundus TaxID=105785 RepID=UPI000CD7D1A7|nr:uncharacterized protein LOC111866539 isoform X2 [Cryptotermes secundus]